MADGYIKIPVELDLHEMGNDLKELKQMITSGGNDIDSKMVEKVKNLENAWEKSNEKIRQNNRDLDDTKNKIQEIESLRSDLTQKKISLVESENELSQLNSDLSSGNIAMNEFNSKWNELTNKINLGNKEVEEMQKKVDKTDVGKLYRDMDKLKDSSNQMNRNLDITNVRATSLNNDFKETNDSVKNTEKSTKKLNASLKGAKSSTQSVSETMAKGVKSALKLAGALFGVRAMYSAIRKVFNAWVSDTQKGAQAQADLNRVTSSMANLLAPVFEYVISLLNTMLGYINAITKSLFGFEIITNKSSKNLGGATKNAKALNKEMKQLAGFDEMNVLSSSSDSGSGGGGGSSTISPSELPTPDVSGWLSSINSILTALQPFIDTIKSIDFTPIQKSFSKFVDNMKKLLKVLGDSFIRTMNNTIAPFIKLFTENIAPRMIDNINNALSNLIPVVDVLLKDFIEPLFNWFMLDFVPLALTLIGEILEFIGNTISVIIASFMEFWTLIGEPIAFLGGELILAILTDLMNFFIDVNEGLGIFLERVKEGDPLATALATAIGLVVAGLTAWKIAQTLLTAAVLLFESINPFGWIMIAIAALIAIIGALYANWDDIVAFLQKTMENIKNWFGSLGDFFVGIWDKVTSFISSGAKTAFDFVLRYVNGLKEQIGNVINMIKGIFKGLIDFVTGIFTGDWKKAWNGVVSIFKNIVDGIANIFKSPINFMIDGINTFIRGINKVKVPSWVPFVGGKGFSIPALPRLAQGTYTTGAMTAVIGEAGREAVVPLQNNTEWIHDFISLFNANGGGNGTSTIVVQTMLDGKVVAETVNKVNKDEEFSTNGNGGLSYGY